MHTISTQDAPQQDAPKTQTSEQDQTATPDPTSKSSRRRRLAITLISSFVAFAVLLSAGYLWLVSQSTVQNLGTQECHHVRTQSTLTPAQEAAAREGVCDAIDRLATAWADQDANAYGQTFTDNATYITFAGTYYTGREDIIASHAALYQGPLSDTRLADRYLDLQLLTPDVAILTTRGDTYEGNEPGELTKVQTYTLINSGEHWKIAAFHNTQRKELMEQIQFRWMPETTPTTER